MKKVILILMAAALGSIAPTYATISVNPRGNAPCSYGLPNFPGTCTFYEIYPQGGGFCGGSTWNVVSLNGGGYTSYRSCNQINIAIPTGRTETVTDMTCSMYMGCFPYPQTIFLRGY